MTLCVTIDKSPIDSVSELTSTHKLLHLFEQRRNFQESDQPAAVGLCSAFCQCQANSLYNNNKKFTN